MKKLSSLLILPAAWATLSLGCNIRSLVTEDVDREATRHELRHVLTDSASDGASPLMAFVDSQEDALNTSRLWHTGTAALLLAVCVVAITRNSINRPQSPTVA